MLNDLIRKYDTKREDQSLIIKENRFYFYVSIIDPMAEIFIVNYYKDCKLIKNLFEDDFTRNYRFSVSKHEKEEVCFALSLLNNKKLGLPMIYGVPINKLYMYVSKGYAIDYKNNDFYNVMGKIGLKDMFSFDELYKKLENTYPAKLLMEFEPLKTYTKMLSSEYDSEYFYYAVEHEKEYNRKYQIQLTYLAEKGLVNARWRSEFSVYVLVKSYYNDAEYQYRADWLGQQSLDIYIPSISVAIEYQGIQHYEAIDIFGGEEGLKRRRVLDTEKKEKCHRANITLIEWKYDLAIKDNTIKILFAEHQIILPKKNGNLDYLIDETQERKAKMEKRKRITYIV
jgi:hypothetical protein